jgi:group I intron endonuclease
MNIEPIYGGIYCLKNTINNKCYIGQHRGLNFEKRWKEHTHKNSGCIAIKRAILKYGFHNFKKTVIVFCTGNQDDLNALEIEMIQKYNSLAPNGYNLRTGGVGGKISEETRIRMRKAQLGKHLGEKNNFYGKIHTKESLIKMSNAKIGKVAHNKGIPMNKDTRKLMSILKKGKTRKGVKLSQEQKDKINAKRKPVSFETRLKISLGNKGKVLTSAHKLNISKGLKGRVFSVETRKKLSLCKIGIKISDETKLKISKARKGKPLSLEHKHKISEAQTGKVRSVETRIKMGLAKKGVIKSEETRQKLSESLKGKTPWNKNLKMQQVQVDLMSKKINQLSLDGVFIKQWPSQSEASRELKLSVGNISMVANGIRNHTGGFKWKFADLP